MASIQAPGVGSNLDINSIVTQLVDAERAPTEKRLTNEETLAQARLSTLGIVKSSVSSFQSSVRALSSLTAFQSKTASVANESLLSATVSSAAKPGQYSIEVRELAQAQKLASKTFANTTDSIGTGELTIDFGTYDSDANTFTLNPEKQSYTIEINSDNNSLQGIRDAVNSANIGVTASIVNDGTGERLVFGSESGAANSMRITVADDDSNSTDDAGLSQLAFDPTAATGTGKNMEETLKAHDALLKVDGIEITRPTNSISGVLAGVTLDLKSFAVDAPTTLNISANKDSIKESVEKFVASYNELRGVLNQTSKYDAAEKKASLLTGDSAIRSMNSQMQRVMGNFVEGLSGDIRSLADIGITSARDGTLTLDGGKLDQTLNENIDDFAALFATTGRASDSLVSYTKAGPDTKVGEYDIDITQPATQASYVSTIGSGPFTIDSSNNTFKLKVDGFQSGQITLTEQSGLSGDALAQEIQAQINRDPSLQNGGRSVHVSFDSDTGELSIKSNRYGSDSTIEVTEISAGSSSLGLTIKSGTSGQDIEGTIGGIAAVGKGTKLTGTGEIDGLQVDVQGDAVGSRGTVSFTKGFAEQLSNIVGGFLDSDGVLTQRINDFNQQIDAIGEKREKLAERLESLEIRLRAQFGAMDIMVGQMRATSEYLTGQLANLPFSNSGS